MTVRCLICIFMLQGVVLSEAAAHEMRPGFLEIRQTGSDLYDVMWKVPARGVNERFGLYLKFSEEVKILGEPVSGFGGGAYLERMQIQRTGGLAGASITIEGLSVTFTDVLLRIERLDGSTISRRLTPVKPTYVVEEQPGIWQLVWTYILMGIEHIAVGLDHLLFVLGLLLIVKTTGMLIKTITAFTVAHSSTLALATLGYASVPLAPLNAVIALSILFLGPEIVRTWRGQSSMTIRYPWIVAFLFGLLHGFGFASGLSTTGMPASEVPVALLCFNIGVELGQIGFVMLALTLAWSFKTLEVTWPAWVETVPGYTVGSLGAFWTIERTTMMLTGGGI